MESDTAELSAIICDQYSGEIIAADYRFSDEILHFGFCYAGQRIDFDPLCKVVNGH